MARAVFPDPGDRLVVSSNGYGKPIFSAAGISFRVYEDATATTLADIRTLAGDVIAGSLVQVDPQSFLPYFLGPDGHVTLYLKQQGGLASAPVLSIPSAGVDPGALQRTANLADVLDKALARDNLELGSAATASSSDFDPMGAASAVLTSVQTSLTTLVAVNAAQNARLSVVEGTDTALDAALVDLTAAVADLTALVSAMNARLVAVETVGPYPDISSTTIAGVLDELTTSPYSVWDPESRSAYLSIPAGGSTRNAGSDE